MTPSPSTHTADAVHRWLRDNAQPVSSTDAADTGPDLRTLTDHLATATVVGLGESTRFSRQSYGIRDRILRTLVTEHGFRALAIQDSARSAARLDAYVRGGSGDPHTALAAAWRPLRTAETVGTLEWLRAYNSDHPGDQVAVLGIRPAAAEPADYDEVLAYAHRWAPDRAGELAAHLSPIRSAHRVDEHVQRHQGIHPGRPFAEHARAALTLLHTLAQPTGAEAAAAYSTALGRARQIVAFHENSVAGRGSFGSDDPQPARTIIDHHRSTGARIVYWDGIAHTAGIDSGFGPAETRFHSEGSGLRAYFGTGYLSVAIGFRHGDLGTAIAPEPHPDLVDADLAGVDLPAYFVDLRDDAPPEVRAWQAAPARMRVISGVYDPSADEAARLEVSSLAAAFDVLVHIRETSPVHWLPEPADR
ncbi:MULTISPECIES: erythromycin esterase family protein [Nocardia]|uniref:erythromycin esterase family protein n=1 Tax=Nocardia TaxID=1817 RepID=UPI00189357D3|nr:MULTISPECIES: erythromycin esterase family protein [Nocardia]MBF6350318.1 erythromycin esterase family protein [Nocardia flavorosea]